MPHACEASSASRTIRSVDSAARRAGPEPAAPRRRVVWECHKSPPLPWSGGCHMLAKQAVLAEPSEASTARRAAPVPPAAPKEAAAAATAQTRGDRSNASPHQREPPQRRPLKRPPSTKGSRRSGDRSNIVAQTRASCRSCPHAAAMSRPRLARMWTFTCFARRTSWNACTSPEVGRANGTPSTSL